MVRGSFLVLLAVLAVGCNSYRSRAQGPFADKGRKALPPPPQLASERAKAPLNIPANPLPPPPPGAAIGEASPVPPRPPGVESAEAPRTGKVIIAGETRLGDFVVPKTSQDVAPPQPPRPPAVPEEPLAVRPQPVRPAPQPAAPPPAAPPAAAVAATLTKLAQTATQRWAGIDTFEAKLTRREAIGRNPAQTEEVQFQMRREPYAVYLRNTGEVGRGREVLYNPSKHDDKVHAIVGEGDSRLYKAGNKAPSLSPDSPLVKAKSRRSIREAGPGTAVALFTKLVSSSPADLKYVGPAKRPEFGELPLELVEQTVRAGAEPDADRGGVRSWYFDAKADSPSFGLPILMTFVETGSNPPRELEYYCYTQVKAPAGLTDADFDVARLGRAKR